MSFLQDFPTMHTSHVLTVTLFLAVLLKLVVLTLVSARGSNSTSPWQTVNGSAPLVIARGGFSGVFPDSSIQAYEMAKVTSRSDVIFWCDVQLTKDAVGVCFPDPNLGSGSSISSVRTNEMKTYLINGVHRQGWFTIDYTLDDLSNVYLNQGIPSRAANYDGNVGGIITVDDLVTQITPPGIWLNIQHNAFFAQHNLSMRTFVLSMSKRVVITYISSPEVDFLLSIATRFRPAVTKLIFRFLGKDEIEPSTNQSYGSLMQNLTFIKTFSRGILVPKSYIWPVDASNYLLPHTSLMQDAHEEGLQVFASDFASDSLIAYNYSYDPLAEYLSFIDNGDFSVDGMVSDFPITPSQAIRCFSHLDGNAKQQVEFLIISKNGASGDYPGCTDLAYLKAMADGADVLDCPVQMSRDNIPFCLSSIDLMKSTTVAQSPFRNLSSVVPEIEGGSGTYTFNLMWPQIQTLKPAISNPHFNSQLFRNPRNKNSGRFLTLSDFLALAANSSSLSGVLISIENAAYLAQKQGLGIVDAVLDTLRKAGYKNQTVQRLLIQSSDSSVLTEFKERSNYELVYKVNGIISDVLDSTAKDIGKFAGSVIINKKSVFPTDAAFITGQTGVVQKLQKFNLSVYVETFSNEFVAQPWDFLSDPTEEIHSYIQGVGVNGVITDFPATAARYRRSPCLSPPLSMDLLPVGRLLKLANPQLLPPVEAPKPVLMDPDVMEPPLPAIAVKTPGSVPRATATAAPTPVVTINVVLFFVTLLVV